MVTIRNDEASAHSPITNTASIAVKTKRRRKGSGQGGQQESSGRALE